MEDKKGPNLSLSQVLITRLPYAKEYDPAVVASFATQIAPRGLMFVSIPLNPDRPNNGGELIYHLENLGFILVAKVCWYRDRHIVTISSKRLTNTWEPLAILAKSDDYVMNREAATKIKKGFENRDGVFEEDEFQTCIGDHWPVRSDLRDRRYLPATVVLNCGQLADVLPGDTVFDPYGNPGVRDACGALGWGYRDGGLFDWEDKK